MKPVYYYANHIYQFSYALPLYNTIGGVFVVRDLWRLWSFLRFFRGLARDGKTPFLKTPRVIVRSREKLAGLDGILVFFSNSIVPGDDYSRSITIFHEHGTSDKRYGGKAHEEARAKLSAYDTIFLSGPKNRRRLEDMQLRLPEEKLVNIGGFRIDEYLKGNYSREREYERLKITDRSRKNILYAPTWRFGKGTLKKYGLRFAREITRKHNLIIRPHYHDQKYSCLLKLQCALAGVKHVYFSNASNIIKQDTFNDFVIADLMISDMSSVIYEFLIMGKPVIIVKNDFDNCHQMPKEMDIMQNADLFEEGDDILRLVDENLANPRFVETYRKMARASFYTEGSAVQRAADFIRKLAVE
ncbi:MAG TPA: hypothetical protein ENN03_11210 [bacterium]|nr:hypothetical protein [bacterium]